MTNALEKPSEAIARVEPDITALIKRHQSAFDRMLPPEMRGGAFTAIVFDVLRTTPKLCAPGLAHQVLAACYAAAKLGLAPNTAQQLCWIVPPFGRNPVQLWLGAQGVRTMAMRSDPRILNIYGRVAHENDTFRVVEGTSPSIEHIPVHGDDCGDTMAAYAVAAYRDGHTAFEVVWGRDLDKISQNAMASKGSPDASPWSQWYDRMAIKTAIKRLCKGLSLPLLVSEAIERDSKQETDDAADLVSMMQGEIGE